MSIRAQPCEACPYRRDVPSGMWHADEYLKLPPYDAPTQEQPAAPFLCHATPDFFCHGWAVVGMTRGHAYELLSLRLYEALGGEASMVPEPKVPLFGSGLEAAEHGLRAIRRPGKKARALMDKLRERYGRLREVDAKSHDDLS